MADREKAPSPDSLESSTNDRTYKWLSRAAIFQLAFCGMILIGFIVWIFTSILPTTVAGDASLWIDPIVYTVSQPIGSVIAIVGGYLLLKRRKIGLYLSIASVPILLINNRWIQFVSVVDWLIYPLLTIRQVSESDFTIYFVWVGIYNFCTGAIAALLGVCWKVVKW